jgi:hypothetical protein
LVEEVGCRKGGWQSVSLVMGLLWCVFFLCGWREGERKGSKGSVPGIKTKKEKAEGYGPQMWLFQSCFARFQG